MLKSSHISPIFPWGNYLYPHELNSILYVNKASNVVVKELLRDKIFITHSLTICSNMVYNGQKYKIKLSKDIIRYMNGIKFIRALPMYNFRLVFMLLDKIRQSPPLVDETYMRQMVGDDGTPYSRAQPVVCSSDDDSDDDCDFEEKKYIDYDFVNGDLHIFFNKFIYYVWNIYLPTKDGFCIAGYSMTARRQDKDMVLTKDDRLCHCQGNKKNTEPFYNLYDYGQHLLFKLYDRSYSPFKESIHDMVMIDISPYSSFKLLHHMSHIALLLWIEHTIDHISAYNKLSKTKGFSMQQKLSSLNFLKKFDEFYPSFSKGDYSIKKQKWSDEISDIQKSFDEMKLNSGKKKNKRIIYYNKYIFIIL